MHTEMWEHPAVEENLATLRRRGVLVVAPEEGALAGGDSGAGRLAEPATIVARALPLAPGRARTGDLAGVRVVVSAGGTREPIDPVRYLTNRSSGKQGHAVAEAAARRGARVTLVTAAPLPARRGWPWCGWRRRPRWRGPCEAAAADADVVVMAAAVADFRPKAPAERKLSKADGVPELVLEPTPDILAGLVARRRPGPGAGGVRGRDRRRGGPGPAKLRRRGSTCWW